MEIEEKLPTFEDRDGVNRHVTNCPYFVDGETKLYSCLFNNEVFSDKRFPNINYRRCPIFKITELLENFNRQIWRVEEIIADAHLEQGSMLGFGGICFLMESEEIKVEIA